MWQFSLLSALIQYVLLKKIERRLERAFGARQMKCTRNPKHTLFNVLRFDLGRMKCTPELKNVNLLKSRLKWLTRYYILESREIR